MTSPSTTRVLAAAAAGALAGAVLTSLVLRYRQDMRSRDEAAQNKSQAAEVAAEEEAKRAALRGDLAKKQEELDDAMRAIGSLQFRERKLHEQLDAALKGGGPAAGPRKPSRKSWKEIAGNLAKVRGLVAGFKLQDWPEEAGAMSAELREALMALAAELGISMDEVLASPDGIPALFLALLAQCEPPPDAMQMAALRAALEGTEADWAKYLAGRDAMSALEQRAAIVAMSDAELAALRAGLTPEQAKWMEAFQVFDEVGKGGPQTWFDGNRATVADRLTTNWSQTLKLDDAQKAAIAPIVSEFVEKSAMNSYEIWKRENAGEILSGQDRFKAQLALMLETQKKIADAGGLSADQVKAMRGWATVYGCNVADWEPPKK